MNLRLFCYFLSTYFVHVISVGSLPTTQSLECVLNYSSLPYQPSGDCLGPKKKIKAWGGFPTTLCCRNSLSTLTQALALNAKVDNNNNNIFLYKNQWDSCINNSSFSSDNCGFDSLYFEDIPCLSASLTTIENIEGYNDAVTKCGNFRSLFEKSCNDCASAVLTVRDNLLGNFGGKQNKGERGVCIVAVVVAIAARRSLDPSSINDFYSCLHTLDVLDPHGYISFKASLVNALLAIILALAALFMTIKLIKFMTKNNKIDTKQHQTKEIAIPSGFYRFSKAEIENALNSCNDKKSLGRGSAGEVYKGVLPGGQVVAIKKICRTNTCSDTFTREVDGMSKIRHPNLVSLFGCCVEDGDQYLVYEYCSNGNLAQQLLRNDKVLSWERRVKILRDCALALKFLQLRADGCMVHRDFKLTNILLTDEMDAKLSDFGLARMLNMDETKVFTDVMGTMGYMDPEYMVNAKLTCASDVYSFGIVALQLLSGQKVIEIDFDARDQLTRKAKDVSLKNRPLLDLIDPRLESNVNLSDFETILQLAELCVAKSSSGRPKINVVFDEIDRVWKNTEKQKLNMETGTSTLSESVSLDDIPV